MLRTIYDYVLVDIESEKNNINKAGLFMPDGFEPNGPPPTSQTKGVVVQVPKAMYESNGIVPEIQIGDIVYFHFNAIGDMSRVLHKYSEKPYHAIPYGMIFCAVRNGEIIMIGGRVLCEKYYDGNVVTIDGPKGTPVTAILSPSGMVLDINIKHSNCKSILRHIGTPLEGQPVLDVKPGELVYYAKDADFENEIEGKTYFVMKQENLLMKETL